MGRTELREAKEKMQTSPVGNSHKGFTLVEIIVVLLIIGLAAGTMSLTMGRGLDSIRLRSSARQIANTLRYAREKAITGQTVYKVGFEVEQNLFYMADEMETTKKSCPLDKDVRFKSVKIDGVESRGKAHAGERFVSVSEIYFLPNGSSNSGEIILETAKGSKMKITTDVLTGIAKVVPMYGHE